MTGNSDNDPFGPELDWGGAYGHYSYPHGNDDRHCPGCREMREHRGRGTSNEITVALTVEEKTALLLAARVVQDSQVGSGYLNRQDRVALHSARRKLNEAEFGS